MRKLMVLVLIAACSRIPGPQGVPGINGQQGLQGTSGPQGSTGASGQQGAQGYSIVTEVLPAPACPNGGYIYLIATDTNRDGVLDEGDANLQSMMICNGVNGTNGTDGTDAALPAYTPVSIVQPCTSASSPYKETLLVLEDGEILSSFSDTLSGTNTRFAFLPDGTYEDSDDSGCVFTVVTASSTRSISWSAGSNSYGSWTAGSSSWQIGGASGN